MSDTIYYVYNKLTGEYGGSGITQIDDETWTSTTLAPPPEPDPPSLIYDLESNTWAWWMPVVQQQV